MLPFVQSSDLDRTVEAQETGDLLFDFAASASRMTWQ
jgi:hypothetical protein